MVFEKIGLNLSALQDLTPPNMTEFNISSNPLEIINQIPQKANVVTFDFLGLGIMTTLFFYLIWKLGDRLEFDGQPFSILRTVGISAGVISLIGFQMLLIGYFTQFYHVVIFMAIFLISALWVYIAERKAS